MCFSSFLHFPYTNYRRWPCILSYYRGSSDTARYLATEHFRYTGIRGDRQQRLIRSRFRKCAVACVSRREATTALRFLCSLPCRKAVRRCRLRPYLRRPAPSRNVASSQARQYVSKDRTPPSVCRPRASSSALVIGSQSPPSFRRPNNSDRRPLVETHVRLAGLLHERGRDLAPIYIVGPRGTERFSLRDEI